MQIDPINLFALPLILLFAALFSAAAAYDIVIFRRRRKNHTKAVYRCANCRHIYTVLRRTPLARCPRCEQQNEPVRE
jgi:rubrerythrin